MNIKKIALGIAGSTLVLSGAAFIQAGIDFYKDHKAEKEAEAETTAK